MKMAAVHWQSHDGINAWKTAFAKTGDTEAVTFTKTLDMSEAEGASVPDVEFAYEIALGAHLEATEASPEILAGIPGAKIDNVAFSHDNAVDSKQRSCKDSNCRFQ